MADQEGWRRLRQTLLDSYDDLLRQLSRRLSSPELARDALHETFLRIERGGEIGVVLRPRSYLLRMAMNVARSEQRVDARRHGPPLTLQEIEEVIVSLIDDAPDPERVAAARLELQALQAALDELPPRRRAIFLAAWGEDLPLPLLAERFEINPRTVQYELRSAATHCAERLGREIDWNFVKRRPKASLH